MSNKKGTSREKNRAGDEVEELLLAAEDDLLLKLNVNSHLSHTSSSSSPLDDDLARRFEALKSSKNAKVPPPTQTQQEKKSTSDSTGITKVPLPETQQKEKSKEEEEEEELERVIGADLSARFAALKGSSSKTCTESQTCSVRSNGGDDADDDDDEEDEVEKVIQWAMDAARLDPSSPTDDEDEEEEEDYDDESDDEDNDQRRKQQQKK